MLYIHVHTKLYFYLHTIVQKTLPGENSSGTSGSGVHLVEDHVLQFLIIHRSKVDVSLQRFPEQRYERQNLMNQSFKKKKNICWLGIRNSVSNDCENEHL